MYNYELYPKLVHLTLTGIEDGELEFVGTEEAWEAALKMEEEMYG